MWEARYRTADGSLPLRAQRAVRRGINQRLQPSVSKPGVERSGGDPGGEPEESSRPRA